MNEGEYKRVSVGFDADTLDAIDQYAARNHHDTRDAAVVELLDGWFAKTV